MTRHPSGLWQRGWLAAGMAAVLFTFVGPAAAQEAEPPREDKIIAAKDMPLADFVNLLSQTHKLNIVSPKDLAGTVSVNFHDVPPLDALKAVLEANGYEYVLEQTSGRPLIKIRAIPKIEGAVPLVMETFVLNYATAADVVKAAGGVISKNGTLTEAGGRNAVIVQDVSESVERVRLVVKLLDSAPRQVMIDAKIVELSTTDLQKTGFNWSMFQAMNIVDITAEASYVRNETFGKQKKQGAATESAREFVRTQGHNVNLRGGILEKNAATLVLDFFDTMTNSTIVSRPSIRTLDNKPAHIISGQIVPIPLFDFAKDTGVRTLSGFQEEQIGVELIVTPHINEDGYVTLIVNPKVESIDRFISVGGDEQRPVKNTRQASTTIRIKDGDTAVIGGLTSATTTLTETGLPWFKDLPLIGWFFGNKTNDVSNNELIIFITTRTVSDGKEPLTEDQRRLIEQIDQSRDLVLKAALESNKLGLPVEPKDAETPPQN
jgi:type II secretory pathway component GspD/PulD (secretin)